MAPTDARGSWKQSAWSAAVHGREGGHTGEGAWSKAMEGVVNACERGGHMLVTLTGSALDEFVRGSLCVNCACRVRLGLRHHQGLAGKWMGGSVPPRGQPTVPSEEVGDWRCVRA